MQRDRAHQRLAQRMIPQGYASAESARVAGRQSAVVLGRTVGPRGTHTVSYSRVQPAKAGEGKADPRPRSVEKIRAISALPHPVWSRRSDGLSCATGAATRLGQTNGDFKRVTVNSRFVHARTNHVQRKNNTGRATWALSSLDFIVHHTCLSPPTRNRGSWHPNQS